MWEAPYVGRARSRGSRQDVPESIKASIWLKDARYTDPYEVSTLVEESTVSAFVLSRCYFE